MKCARKILFSCFWKKGASLVKANIAAVACCNFKASMAAFLLEKYGFCCFLKHQSKCDFWCSRNHTALAEIWLQDWKLADDSAKVGSLEKIRFAGFSSWFTLTYKKLTLKAPLFQTLQHRHQKYFWLWLKECTIKAKQLRALQMPARSTNSSRHRCGC